MANLAPDTEQYWNALVAIINGDPSTTFRLEKQWATISEQLEDQEISDILREISETILGTNGSNNMLLQLLYKYAVHCHQLHSDDISECIADIDSCVAQLQQLQQNNSDRRLGILLNLFLTLKGVVYEEEGDYQNAIDSFTKALSVQPNDPNALHGRGNAYSELNMFNDAMADLTRAIEIEQSDAESFVSRGNVWGMMGKPEEAIQDYTRAIQLDPEEIDAYIGRAEAFRKLGRNDEAKRDDQVVEQIENAYE